MKYPDWLELTSETVEQIALNLAKEGKTLAEIGMILRDRYGVPTFKQVTGKKLSKFLEEHDLLPKIPEDLQNLINKAERLRKHLLKNKKDYRNKHSLELIEAKIHRLAKYYKRIGKLPLDWKYSTAVAKIE